MNVSAERYRPLEQDYVRSVYKIEDGVAGGMTVMDLLDYISQNIDPSLGYYRHSVCNHGVCGRDYGGDLLLQPAEGAQAIRDLVISV